MEYLFYQLILMTYELKRKIQKLKSKIVGQAFFGKHKVIRRKRGTKAIKITKIAQG